MINILLYVAEHSSRYYPTEEIPNMLSAFVPMVTKDTILTMIPVMTSSLPAANPHLYMPTFFRLWETFNSSITDDRLFDLCGVLSEEFVAGKSGDAGEAAADYKDVGIWSEAEWSILIGHTLNPMNVPVGVVKGASTTATHADTMGNRQSLRIRKFISQFDALAKIIVFSMSLDGPLRTDIASPGFLAGSRAMDSLDRLITSTESYFHPSNSGHWTLALTGFVHRLAVEFCKRWNEEKVRTCKTPVGRRLTPAIRHAFITTLRTPTLLAMFAKDPLSSSYAQGALQLLAMLEPNLVMPELLERAYSGLEVINESHRTTAVMSDFHISIRGSGFFSLRMCRYMRAWLAVANSRPVRLKDSAIEVSSSSRSWPVDAFLARVAASSFSRLASSFLVHLKVVTADRRLNLASVALIRVSFLMSVQPFASHFISVW
ncbi:hypothetical protein QCA50_018552 [Cerrena zonata]|uniref:Proteasome activator Blm10 middle HEAT repeats region domain-containing protein n=1 Tax=Cerrena zonata TaxID=2478898 RepID=A0AAW0FD04_9APHY